jgi:hypothetical protein
MEEQTMVDEAVRESLWAGLADDNEQSRLLIDVILSYRHLVSALIAADGEGVAVDPRAGDLAITDLYNAPDTTDELKAVLVEWRYES